MKYLFALLTLLSLSLASALTTHAASGCPSFSYSRSSYSGFRSSSPSYRSYSASPSRTFTYRASTPTYSRLATISRPAYSVPRTAPRLSSITTTTVAVATSAEA